MVALSLRNKTLAQPPSFKLMILGTIIDIENDQWEGPVARR